MSVHVLLVLYQVLALFEYKKPQTHHELSLFFIIRYDLKLHKPLDKINFGLNDFELVKNFSIKVLRYKLTDFVEFCDFSA